GYTSVTGDWFALIAPIGIVFGRVGCWWQGCCLGSECRPAWFTLNDTHGVARWPAVPVEMLFNALALGAILLLRGRARHSVSAEVDVGTSGAHGVTRPTSESLVRGPKYPFLGQHFHLYLMAYGVFRFAHEFWRDTPRLVGLISGYQIAALVVGGLGLIGFIQRRSRLN